MAAIKNGYSKKVADAYGSLPQLKVKRLSDLLLHQSDCQKVKNEEYVNVRCCSCKVKFFFDGELIKSGHRYK